ncbi:hypothetical protein MCOR10_007286 [Pyricularia oryzae]|nr:hypothetical protein MCOR10_007286 [Pyricularia oryzae]
MAAAAPTPRFTFTERAEAGNLSESEILNSANPAGAEIPNESDVVVAGGGIHGLIYAIHAARHNPGNVKISVVEKGTKPGYKIGESTLPLFAMWCKMNGLTAEHLLRIFGVKDGLCFYFLDRNDPTRCTDFLINGTPGLYLSGYQLERPISELLFTLMAQRSGVNVYHGKTVDFGGSKVQGGLGNSSIKVGQSKGLGDKVVDVNSSLLIDATGRFRQYASKKAPLHRFEGFNTDAFWGYFTYPEDESKIPFRLYEGCHTNHLCFPEGWFWVIRILSWQGNPTAKLMDMLTYLLDCADAGVLGDQIPSTDELAKMFGLKYRWVTSIGVAARNDVKYPEDLSSYGSTEAEQKFYYFVRKYPLINEFMTHFTLIEDLYGPKTTWFVRKTLTYQSPVVSGDGWLAIGDACGFTNPLLSPGINANMSTSTYAAELTHAAFDAARQATDPSAAEQSIRQTFAPYDGFTRELIPALDKMNRFQYVCFRDPRLGPQVSCIWQNLASVLAGYGSMQGRFTLTRDTFLRYATNWRWGSKVPEWDRVADNTIRLLGPIPLDEEVPDATVREVIDFCNGVKNEVVASRELNVRWSGMFRCYDAQLQYREDKVDNDGFMCQCSQCSSWLVRRPDWRRCFSCGMERSEQESIVLWNPPVAA